MLINKNDFFKLDQPIINVAITNVSENTERIGVVLLIEGIPRGLPRGGFCEWLLGSRACPGV
jgi:hypothetical protein